MEPVLAIVKYIFQKNNIVNDDDSLNTFFSNGISFPQFIALIFNIESIPNIDKTPSILQRSKNNKLAFSYAIEHNQSIDIQNPDFSSNYGKLQLMKSLLINQCFPDNSTTIIDISNKLLKQYGINIIKKDHLISLKYLSSILNVITNGKFPITDKFDEVSKNFNELSAPFIIERNSLDFRNSFLFFIQIQIIFEVYTDKIDALTGNVIHTSPHSTKSSNHTNDSFKKNDKLTYSNISKAVDINESKNTHQVKDKESLLSSESKIKDDISHDQKFHLSIEKNEKSNSKDEIPHTKPVQQTNTPKKSFQDRLQFFKTQISNNNNDNYSHPQQSIQQKQTIPSSNKLIPKKVINTYNSNDEIKNHQELLKNNPQSKKHTNQSQQQLSINLTNRSDDIISNHKENNDNIAKFWNPEEDSYEYFNGILNRKVTLEKFTNDENEKSFCSFKCTLKSEIHQIFKYDEQNYHWSFCKENYDLFIEESNTNQNCPLFLILNSNEQKVNEIISGLLNEYIQIDNISDISILSFRQKSINQNSTVCPIYLFLYIPKNKQKISNIRTVFYQIYSFLFIISDLNITILDDNFYDIQISFIQNLIEIYKVYNINESNKSNNNTIFNFPKEKLQILFLYRSVNKTKSILQQFDELQLDQIHYVKNFKDFNSFLSILNEIDIKNCLTLSNLRQYFTFIDGAFSEISGIYLSIKNEKKKASLNFFLTERFNKLKYDNDHETSISLLKEETNKYIPKIDHNVLFIINLIISELAINEKELNEYLQKQSKEHLTNIQNKINKKSYWSNNQIEIIKQSHIHYMQKKFFEIIKKFTNENMIDIIFEKKKNYLESQIDTDKKYILTLFKNFSTFNDKRVKIVENHFDDINIKGTNYVMKEVEKVKELEVIVDSDRDLKDVIPQDF